MSPFFKDLIVFFSLLGIFLFGLWLGSRAKLAPNDDIAFEAYRICIQRSDCKMTPQDWVDYYHVKWRLEEKEKA